MSEDKRHEPKMITSNEIEGVMVVCAKCGKVLWWQDGEECGAGETLGINIRESIGISDKVR